MIFDGAHLTLLYLLLEWAIRVVMIIVIPLRRPPEAARSWLLLVLFLPVPALILYRLIGRPRFPAWRHKRFRDSEPLRENVAQALAPYRTQPDEIAALAERLGGFSRYGGEPRRLCRRL
jgi:cardiolipin synthase